MLVLRLLLVLSALIVVLSGGMFLLTRKHTYLRFAWNVVRLVVILVLVSGVLFLLERYVLVGMKVLL